MGTNNWLYGCMRCYIPGSSSHVTMIDSFNCSAIHTSGLVLVNCRNFVADNRHIGWTVVNNARVLPNLWTNASGSVPTFVTGSYNLYKVDTSGADATFVFDILALKGCEVSLLVTDATNDIIISTSTDSENYHFNPLPYTITGLSIGYCLTIWSDGVDLFLKSTNT